MIKQKKAQVLKTKKSTTKQLISVKFSCSPEWKNQYKIVMREIKKLNDIQFLLIK